MVSQHNQGRASPLLFGVVVVVIAGVLGGLGAVGFFLLINPDDHAATDLATTDTPAPEADVTDQESEAATDSDPPPDPTPDPLAQPRIDPTTSADANAADPDAPAAPPVGPRPSDAEMVVTLTRHVAALNSGHSPAAYANLTRGRQQQQGWS